MRYNGYQITPLSYQVSGGFPHDPGIFDTHTYLSLAAINAKTLLQSSHRCQETTKVERQEKADTNFQDIWTHSSEGRMRILTLGRILLVGIYNTYVLSWVICFRVDSLIYIFITI